MTRRSYQSQQNNDKSLSYDEEFEKFLNDVSECCDVICCVYSQIVLIVSMFFTHRHPSRICRPRSF